MRCFLYLVLATVLLGSTALAQSTGSVSNASYSLVDGVITLQGSYQGLAGLEAFSFGGHLELQSDIDDFPLTTPFDRNEGVVVANGPQHLVTGVLGAENWLSLSGTTTTSMRYGATTEVATAGDLTVNVQVGECPLRLELGLPVNEICLNGSLSDPGNAGNPVDLTIAPPGYFQLIDGEIYLAGDFSDISSIQITSGAGNLSLSLLDAGFRSIEPFQNAIIIRGNGFEASYGVLGAGNTVDVAGVTKTAVQYSESLTVAMSDLVVQVGVDGDPTPVTPNAIGGSVTILDGYITLEGQFNKLAGIKAISEGGYLSFGNVEVEGSTLFSPLANQVISSTPNNIEIETSSFVSADGLIPTGILFDGDAEAFAAAGIQVSLGFSGQPPTPLVNANVPEPQSTLGMTILLALCTLRMRSRRTAN